MKRYPSVPRLDDAPAALFERGHLWIQELVAGGHLRFRMREDGLLHFGDRNRRFDDEPPPAYRHAVRHVRDRFDREALRTAVDDVESVVFFGRATYADGIDYEWARLPAFLGFDVWVGEGERFLPPDAVEAIYRRLELNPINAFERERRAVDFRPEAYENPDSAWYDGPAAGIVVRNKRGLRAVRPASRPGAVTGVDANDDRTSANRGGQTEANTDGRADTSQDEAAETADADDLVRRYATDARLERIAREIEGRRSAVTFDGLFERVFDEIVRVEHERVYGPDGAADVGTVRSELAARTRRFLSARG